MFSCLGRTGRYDNKKKVSERIYVCSLHSLWDEELLIINRRGDAYSDVNLWDGELPINHNEAPIGHQVSCGMVIGIIRQALALALVVLVLVLVLLLADVAHLILVQALRAGHQAALNTTDAVSGGLLLTATGAGMVGHL